MELDNSCKVRKFDDLKPGALFMTDDSGTIQHCIRGEYKDTDKKSTTALVAMIAPSDHHYGFKPGVLDVSEFKGKAVLEIEGAVLRPRLDPEKIAVQISYAEPGTLYLTEHSAWICVLDNKKPAFINIKTGELVLRIPADMRIVAKEWSISVPTLPDHEALFAFTIANPVSKPANQALGASVA